MSSPQVTFQELAQQWSIIKETTHTKTMIDEMNSLIVECKDSLSLSMSEVTRKKDLIIGIWCPLRWEDAPAHWHDKTMWKKRLDWMKGAFDKLVKEVYTDEIQEIKAKLKKATPKPAEQPVKKQLVAQPSIPFKPRKLKLVDFNFGDDTSEEDTFWTGAEAMAHTKEYLKKLKEQAQ